MIHRHDLTRAAHIIDNSGIVDTLISGYRTSRRGRPANRNGLRLMLLGLLLLADMEYVSFFVQYIYVYI